MKDFHSQIAHAALKAAAIIAEDYNGEISQYWLADIIEDVFYAEWDKQIESIKEKYGI